MGNQKHDAEQIAWESLTHNQRTVLQELFSHDQIRTLLLHINDLRGLSFFRDIGTSVNDKQVIIENLRAFQSTAKLSDYEIHILEKEKPEHEQLDVYHIPELIEDFERNQEELGALLKKYNVKRVVTVFNSPVRLYDFEKIVNEVKQEISKHFSEDESAKIVLSLDSFLRKQILGIPPFREKRIYWSGPVNANLGAYLVYAVEIWVVLSKRGPVEILNSIFGFTNAEHTHISGQDWMLGQDKQIPLSAAFTFHRGFGMAIGTFYDFLGRRMLEGHKDRIEPWFKEAQEHGNGMFRYYEFTEYYATPFSMPFDAIFYPYAEEFGIQTTTFYDVRYLKPSLRAKVMIKRYFEKITGKKFPLHGSITINYSKDFEKK